MIYRCSDCNSKFAVYDVKVRKACACGSWRFWFLHSGFFGKPTTEIELDVSNDAEKVISEERDANMKDWEYGI